jgi:PAS domain S-box-containing protein
VAELARLEAEERFRLAFEEIMAPMIWTNLDDLIIAANEAFCGMVGFSKEELIGRDSKPFTYPDDIGITEETHRRVTSGDADRVRYVKRYMHRDGRVIVAEARSRLATPRERPCISSFPSATSLKRVLTAQLSHLALHDPLTGLANRALFDDRLVQAHARGAPRRPGRGAVVGPRRL